MKDALWDMIKIIKLFKKYIPEFKLPKLYIIHTIQETKPFNKLSLSNSFWGLGGLKCLRRKSKWKWLFEGISFGTQRTLLRLTILPTNQLQSTPLHILKGLPDLFIHTQKQNYIYGHTHIQIHNACICISVSTNMNIKSCVMENDC